MSLPLAKPVASERPRDGAVAATLYASPGFNGATMLYADPARQDWWMTYHRPLAEGEVVEGLYLKSYRVTWAKAAECGRAA